MVLAALFLMLPPGVVAQQAVPALTGRVVDRAGILSDATEQALTERFAAHEAATSNQVAVLTVPSLEGEAVEDLALRVFRTWELGQADRDNGVLLLVARDDRELRIEVGYGLEGDLTDAEAGRIIRGEIVPRFRDGDFDGGVLAGAEAVVGSLDGTYAPPESDTSIWFNDRPAEETHFLLRLLFVLMFGGLPLAMIGIPLLGLGATGRGGDVALGCGGLFIGVFVGGGLVFVILSGWGFLIGLVGTPILLIGLNRWIETHPRWGPARRHRRRKAEAFAKARARGRRSVVVDGLSYSVPARSSVGGSSGGSGGGGGFSGGGGSSGGGGASGSW